MVGERSMNISMISCSAIAVMVEVMVHIPASAAAIPLLEASSQRAMWRTINTAVSFSSPTLGSESSQAQRMRQPDFFEQGQEQINREIQRLQQQPPPPPLQLDTTQSGWQPMIFQDGGFSVWMPAGIITEESETVDAATGTLQFKLIATNAAASRFVVAYADRPDAQTTDPAALFTAVRDAAIVRTAFEVTEEHSITLDNYPGLAVQLQKTGEAIRMQNEDEVITLRMYLIENHIVVLGVRQITNAMPSTASETFFRSFQLLKP
jgi:hypothetical protein